MPGNARIGGRLGEREAGMREVDRAEIGLGKHRIGLRRQLRRRRSIMMLTMMRVLKRKSAMIMMILLTERTIRTAVPRTLSWLGSQ